MLAFVQNDIKKVLAYSTVSQLGYMMMALGVGAWTAGVFHLFTHAFFKALLFLGAGSVSHSGCHHSFDMKKDMGGLRKYMPITFWTFIIGTLALVGFFPSPGSGRRTRSSPTPAHNGYDAFMVIGFVGAFLTAAYMTRCIYLTFFGEYRVAHARGPTPPRQHEVERHARIMRTRPTSRGRARHRRRILAVCPRRRLPQRPHGRSTPRSSPNGSSPPRGQPALEHAHVRRTARPRFRCSLVILAIAFVAYLMANDFAFLKSLTQKQQGRASGLHVPRQQVLPRLLVREHHRRRHQRPDLTSDVLGQPERHRRGREPPATTTRDVGNFVYKQIDQGVVDGAVNGAGEAAEEAGGVLRLLQSGKVQQYGALLFGAAAIGALAPRDHRLGAESR